MQNRIKINIVMPFYLWNNDIDRVSLTHKMLVHYNNIKDKYNTKIEFKFYFIGSENELSKSIIDKYFKDSYYEFEQPGLLESTTHQKIIMLGEKVRVGVNLATSSDYDVILVAGSNDFISDEFFLNIINKYNAKVFQIYGVGDYYNGKNIVGVIQYKHGSSIILNNADNIWWKGYRNDQYHKETPEYWTNKGIISDDTVNEYTGGIIGCNKNVLKEKDILEGINFSERTFERHCRSLIENLEIVATDNIVNLNMKSTSGADLHPIQEVHQVLKTLDTIDISTMEPRLKQTIFAHIEYFNKL